MEKFGYYTTDDEEQTLEFIKSVSEMESKNEITVLCSNRKGNKYAFYIVDRDISDKINAKSGTLDQYLAILREHLCDAL